MNRRPTRRRFAIVAAPSSSPGQLRVGERCEGLRDLPLIDAIVIDQEPLEQRLVPLAAEVARGLAVGPLAVGKEIERLVERRLHVAGGLLGGFEVALGLGDLARQPVLLFAEQVDGDGARVVGMEQLRVRR